MKKRETELDILRFIALMAVVVIHTCGGTIRNYPVTSSVWKTVQIIEASITWCVPIYIMISGRFFLDENRTVTISSVWKKTILRILRVFFVWSVVYQFYYALKGEGLNWKGNLSQILIGPYHFWYLHTLVWLYAVTPLLRKLTTEKKTMEYFLLLFFVFHFLSSYGVELPMLGATLKSMLSDANFHFAMGYTGYYVLGYYLYKYPLKGKWEVALYILGLIMLAFTVSSVFIQTQAAGENMFDNATYPMPNIIVESAALYNLFVVRIKKINFGNKQVTFFGKMTEYGFGVYVVHGLVVEFYGLVGVLPIYRIPLLLVPFCSLLVLCTSMIVVYIIKKIPCIRNIAL